MVISTSQIHVVRRSLIHFSITVRSPDPHPDINSLIFRPRSSYGDGSFGIFLSPPFNINDSISALNELRDNQWIDKHTRAVSLQFTSFNSNINLFAVVSIWIDVELTGGIIPEHFIRVRETSIILLPLLSTMETQKLIGLLLE